MTKISNKIFFPDIICVWNYLSGGKNAENPRNVNSPKLDRSARVKVDVQPLILPDRNVNRLTLPFLDFFSCLHIMNIYFAIAVTNCTCRGAVSLVHGELL